ncbi:MAG: hypothetical protein ACLSVG_03110 [Clostridia bacterium]
MWLTILAVAITSILEYFTLKSYRTFNTLPEKVKKYNYRAMWISAAVILIPLLLGAFGVPLPGLLWKK